MQNLTDAHPMALVSELDRLWFEDHPDRFIRLRHPTDGDTDPRDRKPKKWEPDIAVLVFCPTDGIRFRFGVSILPDTETAALLSANEDPGDKYLAPLLEKSVQCADWLPSTLQRKLGEGLRRCVSEGRRLGDFRL